jgi:hypothetical protein
MRPDDEAQPIMRQEALQEAAQTARTSSKLFNQAGQFGYRMDVGCGRTTSQAAATPIQPQRNYMQQPTVSART